MVPFECFSTISYSHATTQLHRLCLCLLRDVRNRFFYFSSFLVRLFEKNSASVLNEYGLVQFRKTCFGSNIIIIY